MPALSPRRLSKTLSLMLGAFLVSTSAQAIVIRHDVADANYLALGNNYSAVGQLATTSGFGFCTGTLVAANKVLTASHCVTDTSTGAPTRDASNIVFRLGADGAVADHTLSVSAISRNHGLGDWSYERDMAVLTLSSDFLDIPFMYVNPFLNPVAQAGTMVGYGGTGTGLTGGGTANTLRRGANNVIDLVGQYVDSIFSDVRDQFLLWADFDNPDALNPKSTFGSSTPLALEGITDAGDSGGPMIVGNSIVGTLYGGYNPFNFNSGREFYGDLAMYASVQLPENLEFLRQEGVSFFAVPLPSTLSLLSLSLVGLLWQTRRRPGA